MLTLFVVDVQGDQIELPIICLRQPRQPTSEHTAAVADAKVLGRQRMKVRVHLRPTPEV
jgi:hypothetical protein